jgi:hypothetical protein
MLRLRFSSGFPIRRDCARLAKSVTPASFSPNVEHPARMECGVEIDATAFPPSYRRASVMQATLAAMGLLASVAAWLAGATFWWLVGGLLLGAVIPFTLIVILPTNKQLLNPSLDKHSAQTGQLTCSLDYVACREKRAERAERLGALAIPLPRNLHEIRVTGKERRRKGIEEALFVGVTRRFPRLVNTGNPVPQNYQTK